MSFASVEIMAHFVAKSRDNPPNNLHSVWDEKEATKNPKRKGLGQPWLRLSPSARRTRMLAGELSFFS